MNCNREVVILKNVKSDCIEEAILILKDNAGKDRSKALKEAEKIVLEYEKRFEGIQQIIYRRQKKSGIWVPLTVAMGVLSSALLLLFRLM